MAKLRFCNRPQDFPRALENPRAQNVWRARKEGIIIVINYCTYARNNARRARIFREQKIIPRYRLHDSCLVNHGVNTSTLVLSVSFTLWNENVRTITQYCGLETSLSLNVLVSRYIEELHKTWKQGFQISFTSSKH